MTGVAPRIHNERLHDLLRDMVDIYSPSGKEEELTSFLAGYLARRGLAVEHQEVDETRHNLLVRAGEGTPDMLLVGHIDTVPAFDIDRAWFSEQDGLCEGLGTADMKGGCAALIEAVCVAFESKCLSDSLMLALVVGEEETGDGMQALLKTHRFNDALVAEPTELKPCLDHFGYVEMSVRAFGSRRHAAVAGRETNAIRALLRFLLRLEERMDRDEPDTVLNIRDLHSSESGFAVPDRCSADVDLHIAPDRSAGDCAEALERFAKEQLEESAACRYEIDFPTLANGYRLSPETRLPRQLRNACETLAIPWTPDAFRSHSDANLLREAGCNPVILGPGQLAKAHTVDESVDFAQVVRAAQLYLALVSSW